MNERWQRARRLGLVLLLCGGSAAVAGCAQTTDTQTGSDINNPGISPGALNNGTSIGPSEGVATPPESGSH